MRRIVAVAVAWMLVAAAACASFGQAGETGAGDAGASPDVSDAPAPSDGAPRDASAPPDDADTGGAVLYADGFESGGTACSDWEPATATATRTNTVAHSGAWSCHFCADSSGAGYLKKTLATSSAGTYSFTAWARGAASGDFFQPELFASAGGYGHQLTGNNQSLPSDGGFALVQAVGTTDGGVPGATGPLDALVVQLAIPAATCVDFDDVEIDHTP